MIIQIHSFYQEYWIKTKQEVGDDLGVYVLNLLPHPAKLREQEK